MEEKNNFDKLKEDINEKYLELYNKGVRAIRIDNTFISGVYNEPDLNNFQKRKITGREKIKHNLNLKKNYNIFLKKNQEISIGKNHMFIVNF